MFILTHITIIIMYCIPNQIRYSPHTVNTARVIQKDTKDTKYGQ